MDTDFFTTATRKIVYIRQHLHEQLAILMESSQWKSILFFLVLSGIVNFLHSSQYEDMSWRFAEN